MRSQGFLAAAMLLDAACAFKDVSPFFLLSSNTVAQELPEILIAPVEQVEQVVKSVTESCAYQHYLFVHQNGVTAADIRNSPEAMPHVSKRMASGEINAKIEIPTVMGIQDPLALQKTIVESCPSFDARDLQHGPDVQHRSQYTTVDGKQETSFHLFTASEGPIGPQLAASDAKIESMLQAFDAAKESWVMIYTSSPPPVVKSEQPDGSIYEMDEPYPSLHQDLKRATPELARRAALSDSKKGNGNVDSDLPLFEKYQYFTPGLFMGFFAAVLLLIPVYIGISAIAGMEVSYLAFSKEMGPAAQNKGKQS